MIRLFRSLLIALLLCSPALAASATRPTTQPAVPLSPLLVGLTRGVNVLGYDPIWKDPSKARWKDDFFKRIKDGGFDFVRLNLFAIGHMDASNTIDPAWVALMDHFIDGATNAGLTVIVDEHNYNEMSNDWAAGKPKLEAFWTQIAPHLAHQPGTVVFELLNEPHKQITPELWNDEIPILLQIVRQTNPTRRVITGGGHWNGRNDLPLLKLPDADRNLIATFHYYDPGKFANQGASWTGDKDKHDIPWGTPAEYATLDANFDQVAAWSKQHNRPILLGEFGAYDKAPMDSRVRWTSAVSRSAEKHGFAWCYWQFDSDFVVFDVIKQTWIEPIHRALIPTK